MTGQRTLVFWRDDQDGPGCIEYSWVPEGKRHVIRLPAKQDEESRTDPVPVDATHVQLYRLISTGLGADGWQFPSGAPRPSPLIHASVEVFHGRREIIGTAHYADGTTTTDKYSLKEAPLPYPELQ